MGSIADICTQVSKMLGNESYMRTMSDAIFDKFDADHSGEMNKQELQQALRMFAGKSNTERADDFAAQAIKSCDADGDGNVDKEEFFGIVRKFSQLAAKAGGGGAAGQQVHKRGVVLDGAGGSDDDSCSDDESLVDEWDPRYKKALDDSDDDV
eukprot:TRINITY_DN8952_c0_g1_i1.p1 TRINITY_DN8952_c0_g1~~TRINITY_DN8952_c0_g1_i1.p1  ORF type:complete len:153 (+),score=55.84 TRINITY_DN8952_c0_g1_i1:167-625(+)